VKSSFEIEIAKSDAEILATYDVMKQLRPNVARSDYVPLVRLAQDEIGFQLSAVKHGGEIVGATGFRLCRSLGWGKFLYVDDLVTDERHRSTGAGKAAFDWLVAYAREQDCSEVRLDSALYRHGAHRFYLRERMDIACFNFKLALK
jgi:GNAT superfamily N-acetyltransferase